MLLVMFVMDILSIDYDRTVLAMSFDRWMCRAISGHWGTCVEAAAGRLDALLGSQACVNVAA